jgi:hypothetical protein
MNIKLNPLTEVATGEPTVFCPVLESTLLGQLQIGLAGLGDHHSQNGNGTSMLLEVYEGKPILRVWADINKSDPTHVIDLSGALETNREPDVDNDEFKCEKCKLIFDIEDSIEFNKELICPECWTTARISMLDTDT